ncbi:sensor histidine kinase [Halapricum hydrolyticum]|uniref:histidine kinase n=1 Tax=Halapricum hydrolyticum TaxID=2979991 RepID=A0AAE3IDN4_9EURY|nr:HAMP domain-containing sensor histidine kinase [Halapricum hydrolyticum]MCU4717515.1 HAMP domain-containing histidine kinase [Halapricum hydrolyticum]MCU4726679.1 HAMP domain-containing histidine kinase [Halapricum hydrolyticum]
MDIPHVRNPIVLLGLVALLATGASLLVADAPVTAALVQAVLPVVVGLLLIGYGLSIDEAMSPFFRRRIVKLIGVATGVFFVLGTWFGLLSRTLETSYLVAVVTSLVTGAALGALLGVYSARLGRVNRELANRNERLEEFAGIVSHDLRDPLQVLSGSIELAEETRDPEHFQRSRAAAQRMDRLIEDLLLLARTDGKALDIETVALDDVTETAWERVDTGATTLELDDDLRLRADRDRLRQLLVNLFRNAVEHGSTSPRSQAPEDAVEHGSTDDHGSSDNVVEDGGVTVTIGPLETTEGFYIADDGQGIGADDPDVVFESGYSASADGTGFGLTVVSRIAEAHGWTVTATESEAGGARFEIRDAAVLD